MGLGETSKLFVIFWATLFPILLASIGGVEEVDHKLIEMAEAFAAFKLTVFRRVGPSIFVGLRLSVTTALLLLIAAKMIGANKGAGFQVMNAQYNFQISLIYGAIFLLAVMGWTRTRCWPACSAACAAGLTSRTDPDLNSKDPMLCASSCSVRPLASGSWHSRVGRAKMAACVPCLMIPTFSAIWQVALS